MNGDIVCSIPCDISNTISRVATMIQKMLQVAIDEMPNCEQIDLTRIHVGNRRSYTIDISIKNIYIISMRPTAYKTTYLRNWTSIYGSLCAILNGATPAFAMVRVYEDNDMSLVRQFGMNT